MTSDFSLHHEYQEYVEGKFDKSGTSKLEVTLSSLEISSPPVQREAMAELINIIKNEDTQKHRAWEAIKLIVCKLDCKSSQLSSAIEANLEGNLQELRSIELYNALMSYIYSGGNLTPSLLSKCNSIKDERAPLWFDLALSAHAGDYSGFNKSICSADFISKLTWKDVKNRKDGIRNCVGKENYYECIRKIASKMAEHDINEGQKLVDWFNANEGCDLSILPFASIGENLTANIQNLNQFLPPKHHFSPVTAIQVSQAA